MMNITAERLQLMFPLLYGTCFLLLLWHAFRVMAQGLKAMPPRSAGWQGSGDRTGRVTIHPELLDGDGQLTGEDLLTVRFGVSGTQSLHRDRLSGERPTGERQTGRRPTGEQLSGEAAE